MEDGDLNLITYTFFAHALLHGATLAIPILIPLWLVEFDVNRYQIGLAITAMFGLYGLLAVPVGSLSDRYGSDRFITAFLGGTGLALLLVPFTPNFFALVVVLVVIGASFGFYHAPALSLISREASAPSRAFGYHGVATTVGNGVGPLAMAIGLLYYDWRTLLLALSVPFLVFAALFHFRGPTDTTVAERREAADGTNLRSQLLAVVSVVFVAILLLYGLKGIYHRGALTFVPDFLSIGSDLSPITLLGKEIPPERWVYAAMLLVGGIGPATAGHLGERVRSETLLLGIFALTTVVLWVMGDLSGWALLLASGLFGILLYAVIPLQQNVVSRYTAEDKLGAGYGVIFFVSHAIGGLGPAFAGWLATYWNYSVVFKVLAVFAVGSLVSVLLIERTGTRS